MSIFIRSILGIFIVKTNEKADQKQLLSSLHKGTNVAALLTLGFIAILASQGIISFGVNSKLAGSSLAMTLPVWLSLSILVLRRSQE